MPQYSVLKNRDIIDILIGDTSFEDEANEKRHMPYLSGPDICSLSNLFGLNVSYSYGGGYSRWQYMADLIDCTIKSGKTDELMTHLFNKVRFTHLTKEFGVSRENIDISYQKTISLILDALNSILYLADLELLHSNGRITLSPIAVKNHLNLRRTTTQSDFLIAEEKMEDLGVFFISHSEIDKEIAAAFVEFLEASLDVQEGNILCSSVPAHGITFGTQIGLPEQVSTGNPVKYTRTI